MFVSKLRKFLSYPLSKKIEVFHSRVTDRFVFAISAIFFNRYILTYLPDSFNGRGYPHLYSLYDKFRRFNKRNNGGDLSRLISMMLNIENVCGVKNVKGDFAELGVWRGNTAHVLAYYAKKYERNCYLFDTFDGFDAKDLKGFDSKFNTNHFSDTSLSLVKDVIGEDYLLYCELVPGYFPASVPPNLKNKSFSVVSLDADLYKPMKAGLEFFFPLINHGGLFLLHDYSSGYWDGCKRAIDEFCDKENQLLVLMPDKSGSAFIRVHKK